MRIERKIGIRDKFDTPYHLPPSEQGKARQGKQAS
ncbi:MAG: hypothetical protein ACJARY_002625 [Candidatus Azotimanducaceae bacterium]|jgi:hypothetical protein